MDSIEGVKDAEQFDKILSALTHIGIPERTVTELMRVICVVLQLGNIVFAADPADDDRAVIADSTNNKGEFAALSALIGISVPDLAIALTERTFTTPRGEILKVPLNAENAKNSCDAFAKEMYARTFLWLVRSINAKTCAERNFFINQRQKQNSRTEETEFGVIGLLDILGFECFKTNRFGQLCINYANEKRQQKAIHDIFRATKEEYDFEGIPLEQDEFDDNELVLNIIEERTGLISLLNEENYRPKGNDEAFVRKVLATYEDSRCIVPPRRGWQIEFSVVHYAGMVTYTTGDFVDSNQDTLPLDLRICAQMSSNRIIAECMAPEVLPSVLVSRRATTVAVSAATTSTTSNKKHTEKKEGWQSTSAPKPTVPKKSRSTLLLVDEKSASVSNQSNSYISKFGSDQPWKTKISAPNDCNRDVADDHGRVTTLERSETGSSAIADHMTKAERTKSNTSFSKKPSMQRSSSSDLMGDTVTTKYQQQLSSLMTILAQTHSRYVRCIKPNPDKQPRIVDEQSTIEQLRCAGIVGTVKLSRAMYPSSIKNSVLRFRYMNMWDQKNYPSRQGVYTT
jgi:myosin heavy subunit